MRLDASTSCEAYCEASEKRNNAVTGIPDPIAILLRPLLLLLQVFRRLPSMLRPKSLDYFILFPESNSGDMPLLMYISSPKLHETEDKTCSALCSLRSSRRRSGESTGRAALSTSKEYRVTKYKSDSQFRSLLFSLTFSFSP